MSYKEIPLTNSDRKVRVSPEDYDDLRKQNWYLDPSGYAYRKYRTNGKLKDEYLHRRIMGANDSNNNLIDHIDTDKLNCQRFNLRFADIFGNNRNMNKKKNPKYKSMYKGVSPRKTKCLGFLYDAKIFCHKSIYLGSYIDELDAARAYNLAAIKYFGEFSNINNIENPFLEPTKYSGSYGKTSRYVGVVFNKKNKKYIASINNNRKAFYLGCYENEIEAARAYNKKAIELYGDKARLNII